MTAGGQRVLWPVLVRQVVRPAGGCCLSGCHRRPTGFPGELATFQRRRVPAGIPRGHTGSQKPTAAARVPALRTAGAASTVRRRVMATGGWLRREPTWWCPAWIGWTQARKWGAGPGKDLSACAYAGRGIAGRRQKKSPAWRGFSVIASVPVRRRDGRPSDRRAA